MIDWSFTLTFSDIGQDLNTYLDAPCSIIIMGQSGSGKCVHEDSLVLTSKGILPIREAKNQGALNVPSWNVQGESNVSHYYDSGFQETLTLTTSRGFKIRGTFIHPIMTATETGPTWRTLESLAVGDSIALKVGLHPGNTIENQVDEDCAWLLGALIADGSLNVDDTNSAPIYTKSDPYLRARVQKSALKYLDCEAIERSYKNKCPFLHFSGGRRVKDIMKDLDLSLHLSKNKYVPTTVLRSSSKIWAAFIQGLLDGDGTVDAKNGNIEWTTASERLAREVQTMLSGLGVWAAVHHKDVPLPKNGKIVRYWRTSITGYDIEVFDRQVSFTKEDKRTNLKNNLNRSRNTNVDVVPNASKLIEALLTTGPRSLWNKYAPIARGIFRPSRSFLREMISLCDPTAPEALLLGQMVDDSVRWDEIVSIENEGPAHVVDLTVPNGSSFVANSIWVHNSTSIATVAQNCLWIVSSKKELRSYASLIQMSKDKLSKMNGQSKDDPIYPMLLRNSQRQMPKKILELPEFKMDADGNTIRINTENMIRTIVQAYKARLAKEPTAYTGIVFDTWTILAKRIHDDLTLAHGTDGFAINRKMHEFHRWLMRDIPATSGKALVMVCHMKDPDYDQKTGVLKTLGGPQLPTGPMSKAVAGEAEFVMELKNEFIESGDMLDGTYKREARKIWSTEEDPLIIRKRRDFRIDPIERGTLEEVFAKAGVVI